MKRILFCMVVWLMLLPGTALAHGGVEGIVTEAHHEVVQVGPYIVNVSFSEWPIKAERSLDILFVPEGGIADKSGSIYWEDPNGFGWEEPLTRFPRMRSVWGMDVRSIPAEGDWRIKFTIDGPAGKAEGWTQPITLLPPPGPPKWISWSIGALPLFALIALIIVGWRRVRSAQVAETYAWR